MEERGLSNIYIDHQLKQLNLTDYLGCFAINTFPHHSVKWNSIVICNVSKASEVGTHFIALRLTRHKLYYYDSFGLLSAAISKDVNTLLVKIAIDFSVDVEFVVPRPVQHINSYFCGFYVMLYTILYDTSTTTTTKMMHKPKLVAFKKTNLLQNDDIVVNNLIMMIESRQNIYK